MRYLIALLLIWIPGVNAADVAIPELGVVLNGYPEEQARPRPVEGVDGFSIEVRLGNAVFNIHRFDDPSRAAIPVTNKSYQKGESREAEKRGKKILDAVLTKIGGQDAWLITTTQKVPPFGFDFYTASATVIVDHQLVRLSAAAIEKPKESDDFQSVLKLLMAVTFEPVDRSAAPVPTPANDAPGKMPHFIADAKAPLVYPAMAIRLGLQGAVDVQFTIDGQGQAQNIKIAHADHTELAGRIVQFLTLGRFHVPGDWVESGSQTLPFALEFQFAMASRPGEKCTSQDSPVLLEGAVVVKVCHSLVIK
jgi:hypothetical protein